MGANAVMSQKPADLIRPEEAGTLAGLFRERLRRSPDAVAYLQFDEHRQCWAEHSWEATAREVARWQAALSAEGLVPGDRVAVMLHNCWEWVLFDQAALGLGLVVVPLYTDDRPDNAAYILNDAGCSLLLFRGPHQWGRLRPVARGLETIRRLVSLEPLADEAEPRLCALEAWLPPGSASLQALDEDPQALATVVYTSGTTGRPKGVMLSHLNLLSNCYSGLQCVDVRPDDLFLSFLPLSHTLERMAGYYLPVMAGARVAFSRGITQLAEDLRTVRPTCLVSVPRVYERVYARVKSQLQDKSALARWLFDRTVAVGWRRFQHRQGRAAWHPGLLAWPLLERLVAGKIQSRLGGRLRYAVSGGAPLSAEIAQVFIGLGVPLLQGYGLTEASPLVSANTEQDNIPASIGIPVAGVEVRIGERDELLVRGPNVMQGYWNNSEATRAVIDEDGWLHTGDQVRLEGRHLFITGRIKEVIVLANGEKVPPADIELAIATDPLFEQVMLLGEGKAYLGSLAVLDREEWERLARDEGLVPGGLSDPRVEKLILRRINARLKDFPGYAKIRRVACSLEPWSVDNGLLTPTLKMKRDAILEHHREDVLRIYQGHE